MDAPTLSAFAAAAAAAGAFTVAGIQLYIGYRQSKAALQASAAAEIAARNAGRHTIAEFRQAWIYKVIDALSELHSLLLVSPSVLVATPEDQQRLKEHNQKLQALRTELEILLNPNEPDTIALIDSIDGIVKSADQAHSDSMIAVARRLLKREWVRLKSELE